MGMNTDAVQRLYVAYFNRPADPASLEAYEAMLPTDSVATQAELQAIADKYFSPSAEYASRYDGKSNADIINTLYNNLFGRDAEPEGLLSWTAKLNSGAESFASIALQLSFSAQGTDADAIAAKISAAKSFTTQVASDITSIIGFSGNEAAADSRAWLATVTDDASATTAIAGVSAAVDSAVAAATVTVDATDTITLTAGYDSLDSGAGNDQFFAAITGAAATATLNAGDSVAGGIGTDTLNLTLSGGDYTADATFTGIEVFSVSATGGARAFDADGIEGVTTFTNNKGSQNLTVTNMEAASTTLGFNKISTANTTSVTWKNAALAGADDTVAITLNNVTAAEVISLRSAGANDIENVTIASNGTLENFMGAFTVQDTAAATMSKLTITGSANLDMDDTALEFAGAATTSTATFDASAMTGRVKVDLDETTNLRMTATGGSGNDTFDFGDSLDSNDTVDMGDGTDTIVIDSIATGTTTALATAYSVSNTENFSIEGATSAAYTISALGQTGLEKIVIKETGTAGNVTITNLAPGVAVQLDNTDNGQNIDTVTLSLADATGSEDSLTVAVNGTTGHGTDNDVVDIAISNIETLNLTSGIAGATALGAAEENIIEDISADTSLATITVSGGEKSNITLGAEMTGLTAFNASGATDDVTVDASGLSSATTFTGGSREDTFTMGATLNYLDTIDGGADVTTGGDLVSATVTGLTSVTGALNISNVETLDLTNNGVATINAASITGASTINIFASSDTTNLTNLSSGATVGIGKTGVADVTAGAIDVKLADATGDSDVINFGLNEATSATLTGTAIETANFILSTTDTDIAETTLTISALNATSLTITGANGDTGHTLGLGTLDTDSTSVDASGYRGILTAQGSTAATTFTLRGGVVHDVTGGTGNDTMTISSGAANYNVDGGAGTDTLTMTISGAVDTVNMANFETSTINVANSATTSIVLATGEYVNDSDLTKLTIAGGNNISTFTMGGAAMGATGAGADAIGIAAGSEATGLTEIDGSGFNGALTLTFGDGVVDNSLTIKGGAGTDTVNAAYAGSTDTVHLSGIEYFKVQADATANVDLTDTAGLTRVYVDDDGTAAATTLTDLPTGVDVYFTTGVTGSSLTIDMETASGSSDVLNVELVASTGSSTLTVTNVETLNLDVEGAFSLDLGATTMSTSGATSSLILTGDSALTLAGTDTDIRTIDASAMSTGGSIVQTGREATGASTYTGSIGADTFILMSPSDVMAGGAGSDTLDINYAAILGGLSVDLTQTDQIVSFNGAATAGSVATFENVDASGYTGSFGALLVGNTSANTFTGTSNADQLQGGSGIDTITGGDGADTVDLGSDTDADNYVISAVTDGGALSEDESSNADTVNNFTQGTDDVGIATALEAALPGGNQDGTLDVATAATNGINKTTGDNEVFIMTATEDDLDDLSNVLTDIGTVVTAAGDDFFVVVNNAAGTQAGIYYVETGGANASAALTAAEIALVGIVNTSAALATGDFELI